ncbi:uncharacterized protein BO80DRAFT_502497 [Aspergillus ibericus CBS 121593]|uniref:FRG1-like family protein n=1 Tax=Aspergillus ibericus CBS 121593 TaxID=1448316 RepID=A0A395GZB6_9EURO|nr:hypothetical protein BO80DRAFT_502497 [Aspergillus ibericus CBS 121593]RAL00429.1 hypothetical protein BO80DRAFT_502497 [Aspergillus ibericus CBS 121593]
MVKPLTFKGDKPKKRKHTTDSSTSSAPKKKPTLTTSSESQPPAINEEEDASTLSDQSWVSADTPTDISGPILLVLRTNPPTCLATDAHGTVFASQIENLIEGDPATAEPHDVRQVWVATKVAGIEGWSLRGGSGKYLTSDKHGILSAAASAVSRHEIFTITESESGGGGFFNVGTASSATTTGDADTPEGQAQGKENKNKPTFLCAKEVLSKTTASGVKVEVRGDETKVESNEGTNVRVRMQARFKPRIQASKEIKAREKIGRKELEGIVGRRLDEDEVRRLRKARKEGDFHEAVLDVKVRGKHDKFA